MTTTHEDRGFTLIELVTTMAMLAVLATIAVPNYRDVIVKADATAILADADMIEKAGYQVQAESGRFPGNTGWGTVPVEMEKYLPGGFDFAYQGMAQYMWFSWSLTRWVSTPAGWRREPYDIVLIGIQSPRQDLIAAIRSLHGGQTLGVGNYVYLVLRWS